MAILLKTSYIIKHEIKERGGAYICLMKSIIELNGIRLQVLMGFLWVFFRHVGRSLKRILWQYSESFMVREF
jgi:hypothetical protein